MTSTIVASFVAVYAALFPVINPLGGGPIFLNMVQGCSQGVRNKLALGVSVNSFFMLFGSMLIGPQLLLFFGISLSALKLAGGLVVIAMGWNLLNQKSSPKDSGDNSSAITDPTASGSAFFPLTMPLTVGPGSIATAISLMAGFKESDTLGFDAQMPSLIGGLLGLIALAMTIYIVYRESSGIQKLLGANGTNVLMRLFAFILLAIGVQIFLGGLEGFAGNLQKTLAPHQ
jgi:multiple antibiotic resistance protein